VEGKHLITVSSKGVAGIAIKDTPTIPASVWDGTSIVVPRHLAGLTMTDVLGGGGTVKLPAKLRVQDLLVDLPVALLEVQ
jgi:maltooligosyltrehalose synthase